MMRPTKQKFKHDPANGVWGDCERAAWATLLNLDLDSVPHFFEGGCSSEEAIKRTRAFEKTIKLYHISIPFHGCLGLKAILAGIARNNPEAEYLLCGQSRNKVDHTVVCRGGEIIHDPALDNSGIEGPCADGFYWIKAFTQCQIKR
jgi:hypothetical protein